MYAIIETGGKQYRVEEGDLLDVELLGEGKEFVFKVSFLHDGTRPHVEPSFLARCTVQATLVAPEVKGPKVIAFKYKKCKNYRRTVGHRQKYTRVKITKIAAAA